MDYEIRELEDHDRNWVKEFFIEHWGADLIVAKGKLYRSSGITGGFCAEREGRVVGLITYWRGDREAEVVTLDSLDEGKGIGSRLIERVLGKAKEIGLASVSLICTNDNMHALRFYQRRGFRMRALFPNAMEISRKYKPNIPLTGNDGVPLRDEIELEFPLS